MTLAPSISVGAVAPFTPLITFLMVLAIGAALKPAPPTRALTSGTDSTAASGNLVGRKYSPSVPGGQRLFTVGTIRSLARRRQRLVDAAAAATWCGELARAVRSGATLTAALRTSPAPAEITPAVTAVCLSLDRGQALGDALRNAQSDSPHLNLVLTVLRACADHGGPAAEPLDRAAATLRARAADHADRLTQSAQARMSATVMTCLPLAMLAMMTITSGSVRGAVFSPVGLLAVMVGATLNVSGWLWMRRTINRDAA